MCGNSFAFAVGVGRKIDGIGRLRQLLQLDQDLFFPWDHDVFGVKIVLNIDAEVAFGQVFHMAEGSLDRVSRAQIFLDGLRLGRRLNND